MAKSKKKRLPAKKYKGYHPLSKADKFLYASLEVVGALLIIVPLVSFDQIAGLFIFKNPDVLSFETRWTLLLLFPFVFVYLIYIGDSLCNKVPVFGNKKVDYYNTLNHKFILPLFDKRYKSIERYKEYRNKQIKKIGIWICVLTVLFALAIMGCIGRHEFTREDISTYSVFNNVTEKHSYDEVESYEISAIDIYRYSRRGGYFESDIYVTVKLQNGDDYTASYNTARDVYSLEEIDNLLKGKKKSVNSVDLQDFTNRHSFTDDELKVIYKLFET